MKSRHSFQCKAINIHPLTCYDQHSHYKVSTTSFGWKTYWWGMQGFLDWYYSEYCVGVENGDDLIIGVGFYGMCCITSVTANTNNSAILEQWMNSISINIMSTSGGTCRALLCTNRLIPLLAVGWWSVLSASWSHHYTSNEHHPCPGAIERHNIRLFIQNDVEVKMA